jgi:hypothetical protein
MPDANIGIACGDGSAIVVVDIDGPEGELSWAEMLVGHDEPETLEAITGRADGGRQLIFEHPGEQMSNRGGVEPGVDLRGDGGYIVVAPSIHPDTGRRYGWATHMPPASMPGWLVERLKPAPATSAAPPRRCVPVGGSSYGRGALRAAAEAARSCPEGCRASRLWQHATAIGELVAGREVLYGEAWHELVGAGLASGLEEWEAERQVREGMARGMERPRGAPSRCG